MILRLVFFLTVSSACFAQTDKTSPPVQSSDDFAAFVVEAKQGNVDAQLKLADGYLRGKGVEESDAEGFRWFLTAQGTPKDLRKAYTWLLLAQRAGFQDDQGALQLLTYQMTKDQIAEAERDADVWASAH